MTEEDIINKMVNPRRLITSAHPAVYGGFDSINPDPKRAWVDEDAPCHASLARPGGYNKVVDFIDTIITSYPIHNEKLDVKWFNFMRNHLYKAYSQYISLDTHAPTGIRYIRITNCDKIPAPIVYNLCICSRVIVEKRHELKQWGELVEAGVPPGLAYPIACGSYTKPYGRIKKPRFAKPEVRPRDANGRFMAYQRVLAAEEEETGYTLLDGRITNPIPNWTGHLSIDGSVNIQQIVDGNPISDKDSYQENQNACLPTNVIWGKSQDTRHWGGKTIRSLVEQYTQKQQKEVAA